MELGTWNLGLGAWKLILGIWNLELGIWNLGLVTWTDVLTKMPPSYANAPESPKRSTQE